MLYESVMESVAAYNSRKKQLETQEDKLVFKWKFVVIGLGVILIVLIGVLSEIYKEISNRKQLDYDTTFLYSMMKQSQFLTDSLTMVSFIKGLNASTGIVFDNAVLIKRAINYLPEQLLPQINDKQNLVYMFQISNGNQNDNATHNFGMFLQKAYNNQTGGSEVLIAESRNHKVSAVFSLETDFNSRLNFTDSCMLYRYNSTQGNFTLIDSLQTLNSLPSVMNFKVQSLCLGRDPFQTHANIQALTGMTFDIDQPFSVFVQKMEVFELSMKNQHLNLNQTASVSTL